MQPPPNPCDAACQKLLLDGRFAAIAARLLAKMNHPLSTAAESYANAADALSAAVDLAKEADVWAGTRGKLKWDGCHKATEIMAWVHTINTGGVLLASKRAELAAAEAKMAKWTAKAITQLTYVVSNTTIVWNEEEDR